jgi:glycosyltransferase involved in cell wall biosynthesis
MGKALQNPMESASALSLIVLTYNEEVNLGQCLESVAGLAGQIFVVDSFSTDGTVEVAGRFGAHLVQRPFINQAEQFNWALDNLPLKTPWILRLDADEYLTPELKEELQAKLPRLPHEVTGLYVKRRFIFMGRWIRHGAYYPTWLLRLFRQGIARSEVRWMDEHLVLLGGRCERLDHDMVDHNHKGLRFWTERQLGYTTREVKVLQGLSQGSGENLAANLFGAPASRKRWGKTRLSDRLPLFFRAFLYFMYRYFFRLGFLDGFPGLIFHFLHAFWYRFMVDALIYESRIEGRANDKAQS